MTQKEIVLNYLNTGKTLTQRKAIVNFNIIRLSSIIWTLRGQGILIETERKLNYSGKGTYAKYYIKKENVKC